MPSSDTKPHPADDELPEYKRPEMPWEREGTPMPGRGAGAMGMEFAVTMGLFIGVGWWLDSRLDTGPWLILVGAALGLTIGIYRLAVSGARALEREERRADRGARKP